MATTPGKRLVMVPQHDDRLGRTAGVLMEAGRHGQAQSSPSCVAASCRPPGKEGQACPAGGASPPPGAAGALLARYSDASADDIMARTSVASRISGTSISPATILALASISPLHISSEMCAVRSSRTESSASRMA